MSTAQESQWVKLKADDTTPFLTPDFCVSLANLGPTGWRLKEPAQERQSEFNVFNRLGINSVRQRLEETKPLSLPQLFTPESDPVKMVKMELCNTYAQLSKSHRPNDTAPPMSVIFLCVPHHGSLGRLEASPTKEDESVSASARPTFDWSSSFYKAIKKAEEFSGTIHADY